MAKILKFSFVTITVMLFVYFSLAFLVFCKNERRRIVDDDSYGYLSLLEATPGRVPFDGNEKNTELYLWGIRNGRGADVAEKCACILRENIRTMMKDERVVAKSNLAFPVPFWYVYRLDFNEVFQRRSFVHLMYWWM